MWFTWNRLKDAYIPVSFKQLQPSDSLACPLFLLVTERCETADYREQMIPLRNVAEPLSAPEIESLKLSGVFTLGEATTEEIKAIKEKVESLKLIKADGIKKKEFFISSILVEDVKDKN